MKNLSCCLVALSLSGGAAALTLVVREGGAEMYLDEARTRKDGTVISVTTVRDFDEPSKRKVGNMYFSKSSLRSQEIGRAHV